MWTVAAARLAWQQALDILTNLDHPTRLESAFCQTSPKLDLVIVGVTGMNANRLNRLRGTTTATLTATALMVGGLALPAASAAPHDGRAAQAKCKSVRPDPGFYEAGRKASLPLTVPHSSCTTISVSHIKDTANPSDRCQTFLVGFFPPDGSEATYTEPVTACSVPSNTRTVLASQVPDGMVYRILYNIDYLEPRSQIVSYKVWH
ncbi:MAG TPA: hypothetical protein VFC19_27295 [Candidatus Limnocylindrales bacterium]|nr:hypothetical protein [Candidatus Limnocylindrales bacterium]